MSKLMTRRKLITTGLGVAAGASGIAVATRLANRYGLIPPDNGGLFGIGETLTYAAQRILMSHHSLAREFNRSEISKVAPVNGDPPETETYHRFAEWTGVPLKYLLSSVGILPQARYVVLFPLDPYWESIDMADALHPQTLLAYSMNGEELPAPHGAPLRLRLPRQIGYKNVKYLSHIKVVDTVKNIGKGVGGANVEGGYSWYAGI